MNKEIIWILTIIASVTKIDCSVLTYHYGDGSYFIGTVDRHGRPSQGEYYENGMLRYNGSWHEGKYDGSGVLFGENGDFYEGHFTRGEMTGEGMWQNIKDEEMIEGEFKNGTVSGRAVWERQDGVRFEGVFRRGHAHGPGVVSWSDSGYRMTVDFKKGYPHGQAVLESVSDSEATKVWAGQFWNGVVINDDHVSDEFRGLFDVFNEQPFRTNNIEMNNKI